MHVVRQGGFGCHGSLRFLFRASLCRRKITIKDVTGRDVEINAPVEHVILGEGRQIYFVAALDRDEPFKRIVGWRDDLHEGRSRKLRGLSREISRTSPSCRPLAA